MFCSACGNKLKADDNFCSKCGRNRYESERGNTLSGNSNNNNIVGDNNIVYSPHISEDSAHIHYYRNKKVRIPISKNVLFTSGGILGLVGLMANISSILSFFGFGISIDLPHFTKIPLMLCFILGSSIVLFLWQLKKHGFIRISSKALGGRGFNIESINGKLFATQIVAACPYCNDKVKLIDINGITIGVCNRNPLEHRFEFDYTFVADEPNQAIYTPGDHMLF